MKETFDRALRLLLKHEGGYVNHPKDPGGMTNLGVTKKTWEGWVGHAVTEHEIRSLTPEKVAPLYKERYWDAVRGDELPPGVDYCMFDAAVNSGPNKAVKLLQDALGVSMDGVFGPGTLGALRQQDAIALIAAFTTARLDFLHRLPTWTSFGKGWQRRVEEVETHAKGMVKR